MAHLPIQLVLLGANVLLPLGDRCQCFVLPTRMQTRRVWRQQQRANPVDETITAFQRDERTRWLTWSTTWRGAHCACAGQPVGHSAGDADEVVSRGHVGAVQRDSKLVPGADRALLCGASPGPAHRRVRSHRARAERRFRGDRNHAGHVPGAIPACDPLDALQCCVRCIHAGLLGVPRGKSPGRTLHLRETGLLGESGSGGGPCAGPAVPGTPPRPARPVPHVPSEVLAVHQVFRQTRTSVRWDATLGLKLSPMCCKRRVLRVDLPDYVVLVASVRCRPSVDRCVGQPSVEHLLQPEGNPTGTESAHLTARTQEMAAWGVEAKLCHFPPSQCRQ